MKEMLTHLWRSSPVFKVAVVVLAAGGVLLLIGGRSKTAPSPTQDPNGMTVSAGNQLGDVKVTTPGVDPVVTKAVGNAADTAAKTGGTLLEKTGNAGGKVLDAGGKVADLVGAGVVELGDKTGLIPSPKSPTTPTTKSQ